MRGQQKAAPVKEPLLAYEGMRSGDEQVAAGNKRGFVRQARDTGQRGDMAPAIGTACAITVNLDLTVSRDIGDAGAELKVSVVPLRL